MNKLQITEFLIESNNFSTILYSTILYILLYYTIIRTVKLFKVKLLKIFNINEKLF